MSVVHIEPREGHTSHEAKHLRHEGFLPMAIIHPQGETELIKAPIKEVSHALHDAAGLGIVECETKNGEHHTMLVKHVDVEPLTRTVIHVTLQEVHDHDTIRISVPIVAKGTCRAVQLGEAVLVQPNLHIRVKSEVDHVPHEFEVDVTGLHIGESIMVKHLTLPEGVKCLNAPDDPLFFLKPTIKVHVEPKPKTTEAAATTEETGDKEQA